MSDTKKYYYLKLKENFFNSDEIILIESMQDGMLYSNILLKLYLLSLKFNGYLRLNENMNYTAQMIATLTRHEVGTCLLYTSGAFVRDCYNFKIIHLPPPPFS